MLAAHNRNGPPGRTLYGCGRISRHPGAHFGRTTELPRSSRQHFLVSVVSQFFKTKGVIVSIWKSEKKSGLGGRRSASARPTLHGGGCQPGYKRKWEIEAAAI